MKIYILITFVLLFSLLLVELTKNKILENLFYNSIFIILFLIAGFRSVEVGSDSYTYAYLYSSFEHGGYIKPNILNYFSSRMEYGFLLINKFLYSINSNYVLLFSFFSFFTLLITFYVINKLSLNKFLSLIIFFGYRLFTFSMSAIRASFSISLCMLAFYFFVKKRKVLALIIILISSAFHLSSLAFLLIFVIDKVKLNYKNIFLSSLLTLIIYFNFNRIIFLTFKYFNRYSSYLTKNNFIGFNLASFFNFLIILVIFLLGEIYLKNKNNYILNILRKIMFLNLLISFIAIKSSMFGRFTLLFGNLILIYIPIIVEQIEKFNYRAIIKLFIVFGFISYFFIILILKPEWNVIVPYKNLIFDFLFV